MAKPWHNKTGGPSPRTTTGRYPSRSTSVPRRTKAIVGFGAVGISHRLAVARGVDLTLGVLLDRLAAIRGDQPLASEDGDDGAPGLSFTHAGAADLVARWAGALQPRIDPGDRVVVVTPNSYRTFLLCLAVIRAGGVAVPVNTRMREQEV